MDLERAQLLKTKLTALKTFMRNVATMGKSLDANETAEQYRKIYKDIKGTLNDPNLETYAPSISNWTAYGGDGLLWPRNQAEIVNSGTRLISYLDAVLVSTFPGNLPNSKEVRAQANIFISHGKESEALELLNNFIRAIDLIPVIVKEQPSQGMSLDDKVTAYMRNMCSSNNTCYW